jgi:uncharacterized RDD family membrane protein YckC
VSELVTGEAVVLDIRVAKLASRALARAVDLVLQGFALFAVSYWLMPALDLDRAAATALYLVLYITVLVGYPTIAETLWRGRTVGKWAMGLRVVRDDGGPEQFRQALFRALTGVVEIWATAGFLALVTSFVNHRGKRLGDVFCGTMAVGERTVGRRRELAEMPPAAAGWAATLELALLDDDLALAARQYLTRYEDFAPAIATQLGERIAAQVSARVTPPPPPGVPPYAYLSAVLAERRRREEARLRPATWRG